MAANSCWAAIRRRGQPAVCGCAGAATSAAYDQLAAQEQQQPSTSARRASAAAAAAAAGTVNLDLVVEPLCREMCPRARAGRRTPTSSCTSWSACPGKRVRPQMRAWRSRNTPDQVGISTPRTSQQQQQQQQWQQQQQLTCAWHRHLPVPGDEPSPLYALKCPSLLASPPLLLLLLLVVVLSEAGGLPDPAALRTWSALSATLAHLRGLMARADVAAAGAAAAGRISLLEAHRFLWDRYRRAPSARTSRKTGLHNKVCESRGGGGGRGAGSR